MLIKATANQGSITQALASARNGDDIYVSGGTVVMNGPFAALFAASNAKLICDGDVTIRMPLKPLAPAPVTLRRIKTMNQLGLSGDFRTLSKADQTRIGAALSADISDVKAAATTFLTSLPAVTERMWDAKPQRNAEITYNGKSYQFGINWGSGLAKGILNTNKGSYEQVIEGFTWENGRQEGSSYNASGIRNYTSGLIIRRNIFRDCEDGFLSGDMLVPNRNGEWYAQSLRQGRQDLYGYIADLSCTYDNCGAIGNSHGRYAGQALWNLSAYAHVIRSNAGIGLKFHGDGVSVAYAPTIDDTMDSGGILQCVDFDCGPCYVMNGTMTKASAGTGNFQAPVLFRNDREPVAPWSENRAVAVGNVISYLLNNLEVGFVRAVNAAAYFGDGRGRDLWPGTPVPFTGVVRNNVFRCPPVPVGKTKAQTQVPENFVVDGNKLIDLLGAEVPDPRISTPDYAFSDDKFLDDFSDVIYKAEGNVTPSWLPKLRSGLFPSGITFPPPNRARPTINR